MVAESTANEDSWIGAGDAVLLAEDDARNEKQAGRNRRIRGLLQDRRKAADGVAPEPKPEAFGDVEKVDAPVDADDATEAPPPWFAIRDEPSVTLRLHEELIDFSAFMRQSVKETAARNEWVDSIRFAAKSLWPSCEVSLFGSFATGLCLPNADVDVAITGIDDAIRVTTAMKQLAEKLLELSKISKIEIIQSARIPIMKLQQRSTGLLADIVINRVDGLETSKFICAQIELFPALVPLVLFLKLFLLQRSLHDTYKGGMGSYLLVCVVLSFLQRHPSSRNPYMFSRMTLGNLLFDFFRHYGQEFRYGVQGISVLGGGSLFSRESRGWKCTDRNGRPTLCVESPLDPNVDIGSRCFKIGVVRAAFNHGYHVLGSFIVCKELSGHSLLCPHLLNPRHGVIAARHDMLKEQPSPLLAEARGVAEDNAEGGEAEADDEMPSKRQRVLDETCSDSPGGLSTAVGTAVGDIPADETEVSDGDPCAATNCDGIEPIDIGPFDDAEGAPTETDIIPESHQDIVPADSAAVDEEVLDLGFMSVGEQEAMHVEEEHAGATQAVSEGTSKDAAEQVADCESFEVPLVEVASVHDFDVVVPEVPLVEVASVHDFDVVVPEVFSVEGSDVFVDEDAEVEEDLDVAVTDGYDLGIYTESDALDALAASVSP
eukprot:TRINITY_DN7096_c0_g1_i1.p1 TRINITY_DN7096_c0_g1~~TRINITY_DN7096_c0_g1_i1.p1  ORF type:complete len:674 (-),score=133.78 TRINITY_DN7096_c0_g1_i1:87-2060(-)